MARLVFEMSQSLDGYVDGPSGRLELPVPDPEFFYSFVEMTRGLSGTIYGTTMYGIMRYWDEERPEWDEPEREFAAAWQAMPKWVVSRSLREVGPNATLVKEDLGAFARRLKDEREGEIGVAGPTIAGSLTALGLIDEYRLYLRPYVLGAGKPFFVGGRPPLRLVDVARVGPETVKLSYVSE